MSTHELHAQALDAARRFKKAEADLVEIFQKIEEGRVFAKMGFASLFEYGVKALGLSEANTYAFIQVGRKSKTVPALQRGHPLRLPHPEQGQEDRLGDHARESRRLAHESTDSFQRQA